MSGIKGIKGKVCLLPVRTDGGEGGWRGWEKHACWTDFKLVITLHKSGFTVKLGYCLGFGMARVLGLSYDGVT